MKWLIDAGQILWTHRSKLVILVLATALVLNRKSPEIFQEAPAPYRAQPVKILRETRTVVEELKVPVFYPSPKQLERIESQIGGALPPDEKLLSIVQVDPLPAGGSAVVTSDGSAVNVTVYPKDAPFFEWNWRDRSIAAWSEVVNPSLDMEYRQGIARIGRVELEARVIADRLLEDRRDVRLQVGARISF